MDSLQQIELDLIVKLQHFGDCAEVMRNVSELCSESALLWMVALIYLGVDRRVGARLGLSLVLCEWLLRIAKVLCHRPRPYWIDSRIEALGASDGFGMPS